MLLFPGCLFYGSLFYLNIVFSHRSQRFRTIVEQLVIYSHVTCLMPLATFMRLKQYQQQGQNKTIELFGYK